LACICPYSINPATIETVNFSSNLGDIDYSKVVLYVPKGSIDSYKKSKGWWKFKNLKEIE